MINAIIFCFGVIGTIAMGVLKAGHQIDVSWWACALPLGISLVILILINGGDFIGDVLEGIVDIFT